MTVKIRILNLFRNVFKIPFLERWVVKKTLGKYPSTFFGKLVPNAYQYKPSTFRIVDRNGIRLKLDISDYMGHYLYFGFADPSINQLFSLCREGNNVLDVGTNIGTTLIKFAQLSKNGHIIGFEPDEYNRNACLGNMSLNNVTNAKVLPYGLGAAEGIFKMEVLEEHNRGCNRITDETGDNVFDVYIKRMDDVAEVKALGQIDLIKIDVEGYELKVLSGAENILTTYHPSLYIELDDQYLKEQGDSAKKLIQYLNSAGYKRIFNVTNNEDVTTDTNFNGCHFDIIAKAV